MSPSPSALLADHPDRIRWNAKYECADPTEAVFAPISWLGDVLQFGVPEGPVLELACGRSGTALGLAAAGRCVTAIDVSDTALVQLELEATRRELADRLTLVHADLCSWQSGDGRFALVLCRSILASAHFSPGLRGCGAGRCSGVGGMAAAHRCRSGYPSSRMVLEARPARV